jgi:hypothetical protein
MIARAKSFSDSWTGTTKVTTLRQGASIYSHQFESVNRVEFVI